MDAYNLPYNVRDVLLRLGFLVGMGVGVFLIVRKQVVAGGLTVTAFVLFSLDPLLEVILFRVLWNTMSTDSSYQALNWTYACASSAANLLGVGALLVALILAVRNSRLNC
jgi:ABC-type sulfate transport system permease component